ncbi:hypothetical protein DV738_g4589, partial [Chaetothyriales sp. CBS 135597]
MAPTPSPLLVSLIQAYLRRHGLKATSKALDKELGTADRGLSTAEEEIVQKHTLEAILSSWQASSGKSASVATSSSSSSPSPAASKTKKQASKKTKAKPGRSRASPSPSPSSSSSSDSDADDEDEPPQAKSRTATQKAAAATEPASKGVKRKAAELSSEAEQDTKSSNKGKPAPAATQHKPAADKQQALKDDDSAIVSSSSGTVVGTTTPTPKKKHTGARPTPLAALSASATPGSHISNAYQSYEYADKAYRDLSVTRGKGFTKEKNKKKRGSYRGGPIDISGGKSFKFDD